MKFPTEWNNKIHVPNHQPVYIYIIYIYMYHAYIKMNIDGLTIDDGSIYSFQGFSSSLLHPAPPLFRIFAVDDLLPSGYG